MFHDWGRFGDKPRDKSWYDTAQVCINGHLINEMSVSSPDHNRPFCPKCGCQTITKCVDCQTDIPGFYHVSGVFVGGPPEPPPAFCGNCGHAFPWTERRLTAARAMTEDLDRLTEEERRELQETIEDLVRDTPMTQVSAGRFQEARREGWNWCRERAAGHLSGRYERHCKESAHRHVRS